MGLFVDIEKRYGDFSLTAWFETGAGVMGILGPSGCGKSLTLRCIAGIETPDRGRIVLDGVTLFDSEQKINLPPQKRQVGYLFQNYALFPRMTVQENILCGLRTEKNPAIKARLYQEYLALFQLSGLEKHYPAQLSGGQQQRVALARILVNRPKLLLLDEPFSALDIHLKERLLPELKQLLKDFGRPTIAVTHDRDEAYPLCSSMALMEDGRIFTHRPTKQLFSDPGTVAGARMTGCRNIAPARKIGEQLVEVPDWGLTLTSAAPVADDLCAVGLREHDFSHNCAENASTILVQSIAEEPFQDIIAFRYPGQSPDSPDLWWRLVKQFRPRRLFDQPFLLGIDPVNVLLLYES